MASLVFIYVCYALVRRGVRGIRNPLAQCMRVLSLGFGAEVFEKVMGRAENFKRNEQTGAQGRSSTVSDYIFQRKNVEHTHLTDVKSLL